MSAPFFYSSLIAVVFSSLTMIHAPFTFQMYQYSMYLLPSYPQHPSSHPLCSSVNKISPLFVFLCFPSLNSPLHSPPTVLSSFYSQSLCSHNRHLHTFYCSVSSSTHLLLHSLVTPLIHWFLHASSTHSSTPLIHLSLLLLLFHSSTVM